MKFYNYAMFLFIFNLMASVTVGLGMFGGVAYQPIEEGQQTKADIQEGYSDLNSATEQGGILGDLSYLVENVRLVIEGVGVFIRMFGNAVLVEPTLNNVLCNGIDCSPGSAMKEFIGLVTIVFQLIYAIGALQLITGRMFPQMQ